MRSAATSQIADSVTRDTLSALITRRITAIVVDEFIHADECDEIAGRVRPLTASSTSPWSHKLTMLGTSIGEAHLSAEGEAEYFDRAPATIDLFRDVIFVNGSPLQALRRQVDQAWPPGSYVPCKNGRTFLPEIIRHWHGYAQPHIDRVHTPLLSPLGIHVRLALNVYLQMPTEGGAIELWERPFTDDEYLSLKRKGLGLDRAILGEPDLTFQPRKGHAIIFRASDAHAVEQTSGDGDRITNSAFLGIPDESQPAPLFA